MAQIFEVNTLIYIEDGSSNDGWYIIPAGLDIDDPVTNGDFVEISGGRFVYSDGSQVPSTLGIYFLYRPEFVERSGFIPPIVEAIDRTQNSNGPVKILLTNNHKFEDYEFSANTTDSNGQRVSLLYVLEDDVPIKSISGEYNTLPDGTSVEYNLSITFQNQDGTTAIWTVRQAELVTPDPNDPDSSITTHYVKFQLGLDGDELIASELDANYGGPAPYFDADIYNLSIGENLQNHNFGLEIKAFNSDDLAPIANYSLEGAPAGFSISDAGIISYNGDGFDYEAAPVNGYVFSVIATAPNGKTATSTISLAVSDNNEQVVLNVDEIGEDGAIIEDNLPDADNANVQNVKITLIDPEQAYQVTQDDITIFDLDSGEISSLFEAVLTGDSSLGTATIRLHKIDGQTVDNDVGSNYNLEIRVIGENNETITKPIDVLVVDPEQMSVKDIIVNRGDSEVLLSPKDETSDNTATYEIIAASSAYALARNGEDLSVGRSFTQANIDDGLISIKVIDPSAPIQSSFILHDLTLQRNVRLSIDVRQLDDSPTSSGADVIDISAETSPITISTGHGADTITTGAGDDYIEAGKGIDVIHLDNDEDSPSADSIFYTIGTLSSGTITARDGADTIHNFELGEDRLILRGRDDTLGDDETTASLLQALDDGGVRITALTDQDNGNYVITGLVFNFRHDGYEGHGHKLTLNFNTAMSLLDFFSVAGTVDNGVITDYNIDFSSLHFLDVTKLAGILGDSLSYQSYVVDKTEASGTVYGTDLSDELLLGTSVLDAYAFGGNDIIEISDFITDVDGGGGNDTLTGGEGADKFVLGTIDDGTDIVTDFNLEDSILVQVNAPLAEAPADLNALLTALGLTLSDGTDHTGNNVSDTAIMQGQSILMILEGVNIVDLDQDYFEVEVI